MSQENVEVVSRSVAALNARDVGAYLACCTRDIELRTPLEPFIGAYEGPDGIRRFFAEIEDLGPDFRLSLERTEPIGPDRVLGFLRLSVSGRASGVPIADGTPTTNVYEFSGGRIRRIHVFLDRKQALEAAGLRE